MTTSGDSKTAIFLGNLKPSARIGHLKADLFKLIAKTLKVRITENDISIINGRKRYAVIEVHNQENIDYILENLREETERQKLKFDFLKIVNEGAVLHCDNVKSQDEDQAKADFENAKNKTPFGRRKSLDITRPDFGRAVAVKSRSSRSSGSLTSGPRTLTSGPRTLASGPRSIASGPRTSSRLSTQTTRGENKISSRSTDLDVTIEADDEDIDDEHEAGNHREEEMEMFLEKTGTGLPPGLAGMRKEDHGERMNKTVQMIPYTNSSIKEDLSDEDFESEAPTPINYSMADVADDNERDGDATPDEYEEIDLRHISRAALRGKLTPRIHRRSETDRELGGSKSAVRRDFFQFLDRQIGMETPDAEPRRNSVDAASIHDEDMPYYKAGEIVYNHDNSKEFKAFFDGAFTMKKMREHAARCICGFLNSDQKGVLLFGVHNDGRVCGIDCDSNQNQEDRFRLHLMDAVKEIYPPVFEEDYVITFAPLLEDNGRQHPSLKVIEIRIIPPGNLDTLYECKEGVFIRRSGVVTGPVRPNHIQEWVKQRHFAEMNSLKTEEDIMKGELDKKDMMIRRQADTIMAQKSEIEHQKEFLNKTQSCTLL